MPLYEYRKNAANHVPVSQTLKAGLVTGAASVCRHLIKTMVAAGKPRVAIDGWYGVNWAALCAGLKA
ncbi:MAG: hypothetical protein WC485_05535, partial [Opitutaceae bacterium]